MVEWQQILIGALVAGGMSIITGIITWWITRSRERLNETRRMQRDFLTKLIANRHYEYFTQSDPPVSLETDPPNENNTYNRIRT